MMKQSTSFAHVATKLFLTIARLRLLLVIFQTLTVSTAWAETVTYTVTSTSAVNKSGTAPDGSSATYNSTYTTKCQLTADKSMTLTLSGFDGCTITDLTLSMKSNKSGGAGNMSMKIGTSTVSSIATAQFSDNTWYGSWSTSYVDVTPSVTATTVGNGEKIVITIAATTNSLYCQSFTLTYTPSGGGGSTPTLTVDKTSLAFGSVATDSNKEMTFTLTGSALTANAELALSGTDKGMFSVSPESVTPTEGSVKQIVTVTYTPTAVGEHTATLTISSTGAEDKTVALSGIGTAKYTVTLDAGPGTCAASITETSAGSGVTLPTPTLDCGDWEFAGWATSSVAIETSSKPATLLTGTYKPTDNIILYAVYQRTATSGDAFAGYEKVIKELDDWSGKYLLSTGNYTATGEYSNKHLTCTNMAPGNVDCSSQEFTLSKVGDIGYSILMPNGDYLGYSSNTNFASSSAVPTTTSTTYLWTPSTKGISNVSATARKISTNDANTDFRPYSNPSSGIVYLYKRVGGSSTTYYHSTPDCGIIQPSHCLVQKVVVH